MVGAADRLAGKAGMMGRNRRCKRKGAYSFLWSKNRELLYSNSFVHEQTKPTFGCLSTSWRAFVASDAGVEGIRRARVPLANYRQNQISSSLTPEKPPIAAASWTLALFK